MKLNKLMEAAADDIEEFLAYADTNQSISALHAEYVGWAKNNGRTALSLPGFRYHYKRINDGDASEADYSTRPTIAIQAKTEEMDDFEKDVLNNSVIYAFELAAEAFKQLLTWNPGFKNIFFYGSGGVGKEQPHSAKILTPAGWTTMGDISVGSVVTTPNGKTARVIDKFPQGIKPIYEVTLRDGSKTRAGLEHLWKIKTDRNQNPKVITTSWIINYLEGQEFPDQVYLPIGLLAKEAYGYTSGDEWQRIESIEYCGEEECSCILLDDEDHLYITDDFIVTHNSFLAKQAIKEFATPSQVEIFKGTISGFTGLLQILWENRRNKIIIFDDNDSVLANANALNILKAAMDSDEPRIISYTRMKKGFGKKKEAILQIDDSRLDEQIVEGTVKGIRFSEKITKEQVSFYKKLLEAEDEDEDYIEDEDFITEEEAVDDLDTEDDPDGPVPDKFTFESRIIFISNLTAVPQPLMDRCITIGMNLTNKEITDLIENRLEGLAGDLPGITMDDKVAVLKFMRKYVGRNTKVYTFRLFAQLCALYMSDNPNKEKMMYITLMTGMKTTMR